MAQMALRLLLRLDGADRARGDSVSVQLYENSLLIIPPQEHARKQEGGCPQDRWREFVMRLKRTTG